MTADSELAEALRRVRSVTGATEPDATLLRRLAIQGAEGELDNWEGRAKAAAELRAAIDDGLFELSVEEIDRRSYAGLPPLHGQ